MWGSVYNELLYSSFKFFSFCRFATNMSPRWGLFFVIAVLLLIFRLAGPGEYFFFTEKNQRNHLIILKSAILPLLHPLEIFF
jgi:hypothetical protein